MPVRSRVTRGGDAFSGNVLGTTANKCVAGRWRGRSVRSSKTFFYSHKHRRQGSGNRRENKPGAPATFASVTSSGTAVIVCCNPTPPLRPTIADPYPLPNYHVRAPRIFCRRAPNITLTRNVSAMGRVRERRGKRTALFVYIAVDIRRRTTTFVLPIDSFRVLSRHISYSVTTTTIAADSYDEGLTSE